MLKLREVHTHYGNSHILHGINLDVPGGSLVVLLGRNGMGKTTAIRSIIGFNRPTRGKIFFKDTDITGLPAYRIAGMGMALVPQGKRLFRSLTVEENLTIGVRRESRQKSRYHPNDIYSLFPVLKERARHRGEQLSGGEQQMLALGRALLTNPDMILMDEPFEGLAPAIIKDICRVIGNLKNDGLSILLVEQNIQAALRLADHVYIISKGKVACEGKATRFMAEENTVQSLVGL